MRTRPCNAAIYGIDLGKNTFHVVGTDTSGRIVQRITLNRSTLQVFFSFSKSGRDWCRRLPRFSMDSPQSE